LQTGCPVTYSPCTPMFHFGSRFFLWEWWRNGIQWLATLRWVSKDFPVSRGFQKWDHSSCHPFSNELAGSHFTSLARSWYFCWTWFDAFVVSLYWVIPHWEVIFSVTVILGFLPLLHSSHQQSWSEEQHTVWSFL
jgi:hypothetical protein